MSNPNANVKNLECLCVKNTSAKNVSAAGGVFKAKINGASSLRSSRSYGYGKLSSIKTGLEKQFRYRAHPPVGTSLKVDTEGPIYKLYVIPSQSWEVPPRTGDTVVLTYSSVDYSYRVVKYHDEYTSNGVKVRELEVEETAPLVSIFGWPQPWMNMVKKSIMFMIDLLRILYS